MTVELGRDLCRGKERTLQLKGTVSRFLGKNTLTIVDTELQKHNPKTTDWNCNSVSD